MSTSRIQIAPDNGLIERETLPSVIAGILGVSNARGGAPADELAGLLLTLRDALSEPSRNIESVRELLDESIDCAFRHSSTYFAAHKLYLVTHAGFSAYTPPSRAIEAVIDHEQTGDPIKLSDVQEENAEADNHQADESQETTQANSQLSEKQIA